MHLLNAVRKIDCFDKQKLIRLPHQALIVLILNYVSLIIIGGVSVAETNSIEIFDGNSWKLFDHQIPASIYGHCSVLKNPGTLMIIGGLWVYFSISMKDFVCTK